MAVLSDPIADFLTRLKNATTAGKEVYTVPVSKIKVELARILQEEGYIWSYEVVGEGWSAEIKIKPKYTGNHKPVLTNVKRVSKPGRRQYVSMEEIPSVMSGLGIAILSTSKGIMTGVKARREKTGGELLALVW